MKFIEIIARLLFSNNRREYRDILYDYIYNDDVYWFNNLGNNNLDKFFLYISVGELQVDGINAEHIGFFALLNNYVMAKLNVADKLNLIPYIKWGNTTPYYMSEFVCQNVFEYYFQQVEDVNANELLGSRHVCLSYKMSKNLNNMGKGYLLNEKMMNRYAYLYKKYLRLTPDCYKAIMQDIEKMSINDNIIGIHVRGVEWGKLVSHPIPILLEQYFEIVDKLILNYKGIFLATDSEDTVNAFISRYGENRVIINEANRTPVGSHQLIIFDTKIANRYELGVQVLKDMYMLSYCGALVAGVSNVSFTARYVKLSRGERYKEISILDNGIVSSGISIQECIKNQKENKL